jgi:signal transduction histidine kinase
MFNSLRSRLIASYVLVILVFLILAGSALAFLLQSYQVRAIKANLAKRAFHTAFHVKRLLEEGMKPIEIASSLREQAEVQNLRIFITNVKGIVLADTKGELVGQKVELPKRPTLPVSRREIRGEVITPTGERLLFGAALIPQTEGPALWVALALPKRMVPRFLGHLTSYLLLAGLGAFIISIFLAFLIARSITKPLQSIASAAEEIAGGNYDLNLPIATLDELRSLATSFSHMVQEVKASRQRERDFLANVSHELKTPLTSIQGFSQAILDGTAEEEAERKHAASIIIEEAGRMARLVEELLELARFDAGQIEIAGREVDLVDVLEECVKRFAFRAEEAGIELEMDVPTLPPVLGDEDRLTQVFTNLLDNAVKHTPSGGKVKVIAKEVNQRRVEVTVTDTGSGIPPEDLPRIFERFYQVNKSRAGRGVGLGLAIAKEIIEAHGGSISVESVVGLGTKFTVSLPASRPTNHAQQRRSS